MMNRVIVLLLALTCSSALFAQCPQFALHGDWTVFYRDNGAPDSILSPDSVIEIRYFSEHDQFTVKLSDPNWSARRNSWEAVCIDGNAVLTGILEDRAQSDRLRVEMSRVTNENELLARSNGVRKLDQISIRVMECVGLECDFVDADEADGHDHPAADPGHAHADR
jgi:hypothetical protein